MIRLLLTTVLLALATACPAHAADPPELTRLRREAAAVTIARDDWGIAHVHGRTDADAVFGMIYAQAEDDFPRVEMNYVTALGRTAEVQGEAAIWQDLRQRLFVDPPDLQARYAASPSQLKALMEAWADGLNFYLATHPDTHPRLLHRFEPWMALSFTEGSIGGDIAKIPLAGLEAFYGAQAPAGRAALADARFSEPSGSNGAAIAPSNTKDGHALLLINPHTSFFFRSELQMTSDEGLDAYGAATWGQFFVYQGFNGHAGWMHTTSSADCVDEFAETIERAGEGRVYRYGNERRPVTSRTVEIAYRTPDGRAANRSFTVFGTHHGPIVRMAGGKWIAVALMNRPVEALQQSFARTKATDLAGFLKVAALAANSSNDTLFADDKGETALLLPQFIPRRDDRFDYTKPVDAADPATDWRGVTPMSDLPQVINPVHGWVYNSNDGPWWSAGADSPRQAAFPRYMDQIGANPRTPHAVKVLSERRGFTPETLRAAAYDPFLPTFAALIPGLIQAYDGLPQTDGRRARLREPMAVLRAWDFRWSADSVATSLAVGWGEDLWAKFADAAQAAGVPMQAYLREQATPAQKLDALADAVGRLERDFGGWRTAWGEINRFQRLDAAIAPRFDDRAPSIPVPFASAQWGSLASFGAKTYPGTRKAYGSSGNSFVAVVEFGPRVHARAVSAGGESGDPTSRHFNDQAARYAQGDLRAVYFYPDELRGHTERTYRPGG